MSALPTTTAHRRPAPGTGREQRPQLRLVGRPRHTARFIVALLVLGAAGVFGIVSLSALAAEAAFEARSLEGEIESLSLRYEELTAEVAALAAPERVRAVAMDELGMVPARQAAFLVVDGPLDASGEPAFVFAEAVEDPAALADPLKQALGTGG